jgi:hypothetical protein
VIAPLSWATIQRIQSGEAEMGYRRDAVKKSPHKEAPYNLGTYYFQNGEMERAQKSLR